MQTLYFPDKRYPKMNHLPRSLHGTQALFLQQLIPNHTDKLNLQATTLMFFTAMTT